MSTETTYAAAPFDHALADVILRSSDNIDFRVFKLFLSLASPVFETLFAIFHPALESKDQMTRDGLVVVPLTEDAKTLDALLRFCYPYTLADDPTLDMLEDVLNVLQSARKYSLDAIEKRVARMFSDPKILEAEPLRCFAFANARGMREEALLAAKYTLMQPLLPTWFEEIDLIKSSELLALLTFHQQCGDAIYKLRADRSWITNHYKTSQARAWFTGGVVTGSAFGTSSRNPGCTCQTSSAPKFHKYALSCWEAFMDETFAALREKPCGAIVAGFADKTAQTVRHSNCPVCSVIVTENMREFSNLFASEVEGVVSQIKLNFSVPRAQRPAQSV